MHGLIQKVGKTYKYYATRFGQRLLLAGLKLKEQPSIHSRLRDYPERVESARRGLEKDRVATGCSSIQDRQ